jgi:hypothetical protein
MLVVTANWAIGDGSVHGGPPPGTVAAFVGRLRRAAWRAGFRRDGRYRPLEAVQVVLAGDTFDGLTSLAWQGDVRPWHDGGRARRITERIAMATAHRGTRLLAAISRLARDGLPVPEADALGRPKPGVFQRAPASVVFLVGDRDRLLEDFWTSTAARRNLAIGVEQAGDTLVIRHGAECDPVCALPDRPVVGRHPSLGESLTVDLLVAFVGRLQELLPRRMVSPLARRLAMAAPLDMPRIIMGCLDSAGSAFGDDRAAATNVRQTWLESVERWHGCARRAPPEVAVPHAVVDAVAAWMESGAGHAAVIESLRPRPAGGGPGGRAIVLGHPPEGLSADHSPTSAARVCLGPADTRHFSVARPGQQPGAVVCHDPLSLDAAWLRLDDLEHPFPTHQPLVTRVGAHRDEPGIVDAA